jgi:hypothetical protein
MSSMRRGSTTIRTSIWTWFADVQPAVFLGVYHEAGLTFEAKVRSNDKLHAMPLAALRKGVKLFSR